MGITAKVGCLVLTMASMATHAQTTTAPAADPGINLLGRNFITNDALTAAAAPIAATPPSAAAASTQPDAAKPLSPASQQILDKFNAVAAKTGSAGTGNVRGKPGATTPAPPAQTELPPGPAAAVATAIEPVQRYIPDADSNTGRLNFYQLKGDKKSSYYSQKFSESAPTLPSAANDPKQLDGLRPYILQLRKAGVDEGKIDVELNRLTPAQFVHWATTVAQ